MLKIKIKGTNLAINKLKLDFGLSTIKKVESIKSELVDNLKDNTPVDSGFARDSWIKTKDGIENSAEYISDLNAGSSKQAPSFFIESTLLNHKNVVRKGSIVSYR
jgi:hypothetical protein